MDWYLLLLINGSHTPFLDIFFTQISKKYNWIPLYIILAAVFFKKLGVKNAFIIIAGAFLCFAITDVISAKLIKVYIMRPRPCHTILGQESLWLPFGKCGGAYGFVSNHAANTMGLAVFCLLVFTRKIKGWITGLFAFILIGYALLNGFSRIYLGVHYPTDVLAGQLFGALVALGIFSAWNKWLLKDPIKQ